MAFAALLISLLPIALAKFKGRRIRLTVPELFTLYHDIGNINLAILVGISNAGGRPEAIKKIDCYFERTDTKVSRSKWSRWYVPIRSYWHYGPASSTQPGIEIPFGIQTLFPGEHRSYHSHGFDILDQSSQEDAQQLRIKVNEDISQRFQASDNPPRSLIEIDPALVEEATALFERNFGQMSRGDYHLYVAAIGADNSVLDAVKARFVLFDTSIELLKSSTEEYRYTFGITAASPTWVHRMTSPSLVVITTGRDAINDYLSERRQM